jgi:hypothetical protein
MLIKAFIASNFSDAKFDIESEFSKVKYYYSDSISPEDFCTLHYSNLFSCQNETIHCIFGVDSYQDSLLSELIDSSEVKVIWVFNKLAKNKKLYKKIAEVSSVKKVAELKSVKDKKILIDSLCREYNVNHKYLKVLSEVLPDNKYAIKLEIAKFATALSVLPEDEACRVLTSNPASLDLLNFITFLFEDRGAALELVERVLSVNPLFVVQATLTKRINSYICLCQDLNESAFSYWKDKGYFLNKATQLSKSIGLKRLYLISEQITKLLYYWEEGSESFKLQQLLYEVERILREDNYSRL